ncbi:Dual specificity protein phosphatase CDC14A [Tritrichomonas foetus]|uniref:protein-tyrosine-phosphatase n=1 Tax=Tritrichomonas foetus TaxID=1144522 RepID=A0A1J4KEV1_9EUKA|nr:Dual specificity protein phosphatase CDC14A [Tritrichomonas foetus]|eukprot:OHT07909.1 Dual specificity protein phosphatase CDC14A [Tritrichomonas foetus]
MYRNRAVTPSSPTIDIIPNRFVFSIIRVPPQSTNKVFYFSIDNDEQFIYQPFFADFGPLSLLQIHVFLIVALNHMADHQCLVHFYCSSQPQHVSNAVLLASAFRLIHMGMKADEAYKPFNRLISQMKPYRDASSYPSTYDLSVLSCIRGIERAMANGWYDPNTFDPQSWSDREQVENGDMNWLIPNKLLAFASPYSTNLVQGFRVCTPSDIVPTFKEIGITRIVRLNNKTYEENIFKEAGFIHTELFFPDGTCPPPQILQEFLNIIEGPDVVALHCKAGLGRTYVFCAILNEFFFLNLIKQIITLFNSINQRNNLMICKFIYI